MINKKREYFKQLKKRREKNKQVPNNPFSELTGDALHSEIFQILQSFAPDGVSSEVEEVLRRETQDDVLPF
jgi:hypothetical protein